MCVWDPQWRCKIPFSNSICSDNKYARHIKHFTAKSIPLRCRVWFSANQNQNNKTKYLTTYYSNYVRVIADVISPLLWIVLFLVTVHFVLSCLVIQRFYVLNKGIHSFLYLVFVRTHSILDVGFIAFTVRCAMRACVSASIASRRRYNNTDEKFQCITVYTFDEY